MPSLPVSTVDDRRVTRVTREGVAWLASAGTYPRAALQRWRERPHEPLVLPCGVTFDVVSAPAYLGRLVLDQLWVHGPGSGPVAVHRGRVLLFARPGTAQRLPALLSWENRGTATRATTALLCHGVGDAVTVPPPDPGPPTPPRSPGADRSAARWVVAPGTRQPWLPGAEALRWACARAVRTAFVLRAVPDSAGGPTEPRTCTEGRRDIDFPPPRPGC